MEQIPYQMAQHTFENLIFFRGLYGNHGKATPAQSQNYFQPVHEAINQSLSIILLLLVFKPFKNNFMIHIYFFYN